MFFHYNFCDTNSSDSIPLGHSLGCPVTSQTWCWGTASTDQALERSTCHRRYLVSSTVTLPAYFVDNASLAKKEQIHICLSVCSLTVVLNVWDVKFWISLFLRKKNLTSLFGDFLKEHSRAPAYKQREKWLKKTPLQSVPNLSQIKSES